MNEWERQNQILRQNTNPYNREHNQISSRIFQRYGRSYARCQQPVADTPNDCWMKLVLTVRLLWQVSWEGLKYGQKKPMIQVEGGGENIALLAEKIMGNLNKRKEYADNKSVNERLSYTGTFKRKC